MTISLTLPTTDQNEKLLKTMHDTKLPAADRGDALIFNVCEQGIDYRPTVHQLISEADTGRKLKEKADAEGKSALMSERYLGESKQPNGHSFAMVTHGQGSVYLPAAPEKLKQYRVGDAVLIDRKQERIVGLDGHVPMAGDIVPVDSLPPDMPGHVIVVHQDRRQLARLHHSLLERPELCQPGREVVYDPMTQFALAGIETGSNGEELLVDPSSIANVRRSDVGAPKPVVDAILSRARQYIEHPDWVERMQSRLRCSYMFVGATGGGKSYHLKLIANGIHDLVEQYTGERTSRLVIVDASDFWDPLFGATERRIARWVEKIQKLGERRLRERDGRDLQIPLIIAVEECEGLLRNRGESQGSGHLFDRPVSLLLQKTESLESALQVPIIWIMTSNRPDLVDPAARRRMGMRQVVFGSLRASEAVAVLKTKLPESMPIYGAHGTDEDRRAALVRAVISYLYGPEPNQAIVEVRLGNSDRRPLNRADVVTPAVIEEAVSEAVDRSLTKSDRAGRLLGLDAADVIGFLDRHFVGLARTLRPHNIAEYATDWYERDRPMITEVVPLADRRRSVPLFETSSNGRQLATTSP
jgi:hypothetical protein